MGTWGREWILDGNSCRQCQRAPPPNLAPQASPAPQHRPRGGETGWPGHLRGGAVERAEPGAGEREAASPLPVHEIMPAALGKRPRAPNSRYGAEFTHTDTHMGLEIMVEGVEVETGGVFSSVHDRVKETKRTHWNAVQTIFTQIMGGTQFPWSAREGMDKRPGRTKEGKWTAEDVAEQGGRRKELQGRIAYYLEKEIDVRMPYLKHHYDKVLCERLVADADETRTHHHKGLDKATNQKRDPTTSIVTKAAGLKVPAPTRDADWSACTC